MTKNETTDHPILLPSSVSLFYLFKKKTENDEVTWRNF